ncbi:ATP-binding protein [Nocardia brasiliensis]
MMNVDIEDVFEGRVAQITSIAEDGRTVFYRFAAGSYGSFSVDDPVSLQVGDVVIINLNSNQLRLGDRSMWNEPLQIGVVRKILGDQTLIEHGVELKSVPSAQDLDIQVGATVTFGDLTGIREIISDTPIRVRVAGVDDEDPVEEYTRDPSQEKLTFEDFGGYKDVVERAKEIIEIPLNHGDKLKKIKARPIRGVMFTGPPGTGKTHLARIIAEHSDAKFFPISGPQIVSKWLGDSEDKLRKIFEAAAEADRAIIFFDEIDSLAEKRTDNSHEASKRLVAQFLTLMDGIGGSRGNIIVIAATNRLEHIDPALLRPGRFDRQIHFNIPSLDDRLDILAVSMNKLNIDPQASMPLEDIAIRTEGWSAARLTLVWTEAALLAAREGRDFLCEEDLIGAFERLNSRALAEAEATR